MKAQAFFLEVNKQLLYLANGGSFSFEDYLKMSLKNRRVRNGLVFYALSSKETLNRFNVLSDQSVYVRKLKNHLHKALFRVVKNDLVRVEAVELAKKFLQQYFSNETVFVNYTVYDESAEMEKFFVTVVHHYYSELEETQDQKVHINHLIEQTDWNNLFVQV
ncbi:hypothetical protein BKP45_21105 [Anaerobacillus alkalidiazotrophicus]|uniref:Uncharacterized protein n=1 Tax=Anaerobacillus alkalidiazotrophicus TaxID=472963 RepID=A0A1S2LXU3_9BACI|nr:hypothetical protein [Anaerobacillus alkalidiazotrophicus]OIJ16507.1 hypothetical protein BKP45_21105 [Anaerobacillus alkalidiazotrophicus]